MFIKEQRVLFFLALAGFSLAHSRSGIDELMRKQYFVELNKKNIDHTYESQYTKNPDGTITVFCSWDIAANTPSQIAELKKQAEQRIEEEQSKLQEKTGWWQNVSGQAIQNIELAMSTDTLFTKCSVSKEPNGKKTIRCTYTAALSEIIHPTK